MQATAVRYLFPALCLAACSTELDRAKAQDLANAELKDRKETTYLDLGVQMGAKPDPYNPRLAPEYFAKARAIGDAAQVDAWALASAPWKPSRNMVVDHQRDGRQMEAFFQQLAESGLVEGEVNGQTVAVDAFWQFQEWPVVIAKHWVVIPKPGLHASWGVSHTGSTSPKTLRAPLCAVTWVVKEITGVSQQETLASAELKIQETIEVLNDALLGAAKDHPGLDYDTAVEQCTTVKEMDTTMHFKRYDDGWRIAKM